MSSTVRQGSRLLNLALQLSPYRNKPTDRYLAVELKGGKFRPQDLGQLNFYVSVPEGDCYLRQGPPAPPSCNLYGRTGPLMRPLELAKNSPSISGSSAFSHSQDHFVGFVE